MIAGRHVKYRPKPLKFKSLNIEKGYTASELELLLLICQGLIQQKIKEGKKGKRFENGQKMSYKQAQGVLNGLYSQYAVAGKFSFGTCSTCDMFLNSMSSEGYMGTCKGRDCFAFDSCNEHSQSGGGFGL